jgi:2-succinyl-6-hydroxy-2,4-cyclohexadiene-1-carboxylate synthase
MRSSTDELSYRIVFVHGFLGSGNDWSEVVTYLPTSFDAYTIDLPGHGILKDFTLDSFEDYAQFLLAQLKLLPSDGVPLALVGYSLGARIIMHAMMSEQFKESAVQLIVLEGGNFGLQNEFDKTRRWHNDQQWAMRFADEPIASVLSDWYQQAVFSSLSKKQRNQLMAERSNNKGRSLAKVMRATSLGKQANLLPFLQASTAPLYFFVGDQDNKFMQLYLCSGVHFDTILGAGHNAHKEQPQLFVNKLTQLLSFDSTESL